MKKYRYYIPYSHSRGTGYSILDMNKEIQSMDDINNLIRDIEVTNKVDNVIILNWIELKG